MNGRIGHRLAQWRRAQRAAPERIAAFLGITPRQLAQIESGTEDPSLGLAARIRDMVAPAGRSAFVRQDALALPPSGISALFDLDGVRLLAASDGLAQVWPEFVRFTGHCMADNLVSTARTLLHDAEFLYAVRRGEIAVVTGVSDEHVDLGHDPRFRHHWTASTRPDGDRMLLRMDFLPCRSDEPLGVEQVLPAHGF